jgi:hypothetical protein
MLISALFFMHEAFKFVLDTEILQNRFFKNMRGCLSVTGTIGGGSFFEERGEV